jgi:hypothetical protein
VLFEKIRGAGFEIGGHTWTPAASRLLTRVRAAALTRNRQLSTAFVQTMIFPFHAAYQRMFGKLTWSSTSAEIPAEADDVMLWATRAGDASAA